MKTRQSIRGTTPELQASAKAMRWNMTPAEQVLWEALRGRRLAGLKFRCQHPVGPFILDFYCPERRLAVEVDGGIHDLPDQAEYDAVRTQHIEVFGYRVLRVRNEDVLNDLDGVRTRIIEAALAIDPAAPVLRRKARFGVVFVRNPDRSNTRTGWRSRQRALYLVSPQEWGEGGAERD